MPVDEAPVGPFPAGVDPEEYDKRRRRVLWRFPSGLYLIGSRHGDRRNLMTANWVTQVATRPKLVGVGVEAGAVTHDLVEAGGAFTVSLIRREDRAVIRKFVKPAEWDPVASTLNGVPVAETAGGLPVLAGAAGWLACEVRQAVPCGSHTWFIGEIVDCKEAGEGAEGSEGAEGAEGAKGADGAAGAGGADAAGAAEAAEVLRMEDTRMSYGG